jgi:D-alanyl-D-alanine carboxypeptidase
MLKTKNCLAALAASLLVACGGNDNAANIIHEDPVLLPVSTPAIGVIQADKAEVDQYMQKQLVDQKIPGATLVVLQQGQVIYAKGFGYANLDAKRPVKPEDRFEIGSITKTFAATAIMLLVEEGKIGLDDKLGKYVDVPAQWSAITIRHLLNHTTGLRRHPDEAFQRALDANQVLDEDATLARFKAYPLQWASGTSYSYSSVGYDILGIVVRKVSGRHYFDFLKERVFTPLGMGSARLIAPRLPQVDTASGYMLAGNRRIQYADNDANLNQLSMAASGIQVSAMDMAKWDASLYTEQILKKSSHDLMVTNSALVQAATADLPDIFYGLGWQLRTQTGARWEYHSGGMPGYVTEIARHPQQGLTVIVLTNLDADHANARTIVRTVAHMFNPAL